jgi:hypothetical protein
VRGVNRNGVQEVERSNRSAPTNDPNAKRARRPPPTDGLFAVHTPFMPLLA